MFGHNLVVNVLVGQLSTTIDAWDTQLFDTDKDKSQRRNFEDANDSVRAFYAVSAICLGGDGDA